MQKGNNPQRAPGKIDKSSANLDIFLSNCSKQHNFKYDYWSNKWLSRGIALIIAVITFLVYLPSLQNGFVNWDDHRYVYGNQHIRVIDKEFIKWASTAIVVGHWHPLTMFSHALDYTLWGLNPSGHHLTSIIIHSLNTGLVFILATLLARSAMERSSHIKVLIIGAASAIFFGIHPLRVESVVWVSERKDILSAFFFFISLILFICYVGSQPRKKLHYLLSLFSFILSLLCKPIMVTMPVILLLLDFYPFRRVGGNKPLKIKTLLIEKVPFFILSAVFSVITIQVQHIEGALRVENAFPLPVRILVAVRAYAFYLAKLALPFNLAPDYPYPREINLLSMEYLGSFMLIALLILSSFLLLKRNAALSAAVSYYFVTLLPVIGLIQVGEYAAADRYTYLSTLGPILILGISISKLYSSRDQILYKVILVSSLTFLVLFMSIKTVRQTRIWKDSITLWSHEIKLYPDSAFVAYGNRGVAYYEIGMYREAIDDYTAAVNINHYFVPAYNNRGNAFRMLGDLDKAISDYTKAVEIRPTYADAYYNRGTALVDVGRFSEAIKYLETAIKLNPMNASAIYNIGVVYVKTGETEKGLEHLRKAASLGSVEALKFLDYLLSNPSPAK